MFSLTSTYIKNGTAKYIPPREADQESDPADLADYYVKNLADLYMESGYSDEVGTFYEEIASLRLHDIYHVKPVVLKYLHRLCHGISRPGPSY